MFMFSRLAGVGGGGIAVVKEYEIITLKYIRKAYMLCLLWFGAPKDIIH